LRGRRAYMSPEQAGGYIGGVASDTFSYAILVAEMLTGNRADAVYQPLEWLSKLRGGDVAGDVLVGLDECYRNLLEPMLSREPAERPGMAEITERWQRFMNSRTRSLSI